MRFWGFFVLFCLVFCSPHPSPSIPPCLYTSAGIPSGLRFVLYLLNGSQGLLVNWWICKVALNGVLWNGFGIVFNTESQFRSSWKCSFHHVFNGGAVFLKCCTLGPQRNGCLCARPVDSFGCAEEHVYVMAVSKHFWISCFVRCVLSKGASLFLFWQSNR